MKHNYRLNLKRPLSRLLILMGFCALVAVPAQAGYIVGTGSVSCGGGGSYSFYSYNWDYYCNAISWTVSRPDGTTGFYYGPSIYATMGNTPGTATISASGWCDPFTGGIGQFESGYYVVAVGGGALPTPGAISGPSHICRDAPRTYSVSAVSGASSYNWQVPGGWKINGITTTSLNTTGTSVTITAATGSGSGTVRVRANSSGACVGSSAYRSRNVLYGPRTPFISGPATVRENSTVDYSIISVLGLTNYSWNLPSGWILSSGQNTRAIITIPSGTAGSVSVAATSCGTTVYGSKYVSIDNSGPCLPNEDCPPDEDWRTGDGIQERYSIEVFPNPVSDLVSVQAAAGHQIAQVLVYNQLQQLVMEARPQAASAQLDLKRLDNGVYFLQVKGEAEEEQTHRIIVQH